MMTQNLYPGEHYRFGSQPLGYYGLGSTGSQLSSEEDLIFDDLIEEYGARFEKMERLTKLAFRAVLANYLYQLEICESALASPPETLILEAIDQTYPALWQEEPHLCEYLEQIAMLDKTRIESLLEALTAQLHHDHLLTKKEAA
ncbi:hypothetical protein [Nostoc sp. ChiQUE01b]|uniref:hypothetical protein n=1 Tax=Nostoc sp. ChiQUE01b TaxID=3075376 RepID=UPI002AD59269|nr:hypothetical protein [Nostoc sp. ChiQUE01b]MDZ8260622.1 hypothetical protein [Nostoc sp. ChiQUE01b]